MRVWTPRVGMRRTGMTLLVGALLGALLGTLSGCGHDPNHGVDMEQARAAGRRVHAPPEPGAKMMPGEGG